MPKNSKIVVGSGHKRARNSYNFFYTKEFKLLKKKNPNLAVKDIAKQLGSKWNRLSNSQKKPYEDMALKDKYRAEKEKKIYNKTSKRKYDGKNKPNKYIEFLKKRGDQIRKENPNLSFGEVSKMISKEWKNKKNYIGKQKEPEEEMDNEEMSSDEMSSEDF